MAEQHPPSKASLPSCQGLEVVPADDSANMQYPDPPSPQPSVSGFNVIRLSSDGGTNQQVLPENLEVSRVVAHGVGCRRNCSGSTVIPVGGTLSRPIKKNRAPVASSESDFKATIRERNAVMYLNEWLADVHFIVGGDGERERIPAHSYVLSISSSTFIAMFHGGFAHKSEIEIPDVEPTAFKILLKYLYTDEVEMKGEYALCTLYAAKKYLVTHLANAVIAFLEANLNADNVCLLLSQVTLFEEEELINRCWELVDANAECVLRSEGFLSVDPSLFEKIIKRETLIIRERTVFEASVKWAKAECDRHDLEPTAKNLRSALGEALFHIRFPTMSIGEFANGAAKSGLLTCQETNNVFLHFAAEEKPRLPFPIERRDGLPLQVCCRFHTVLQGTNQWRYRGRCDSIQFMVDRRIFVAGYGLYGSNGLQSQYSVKMELKKGQEVLSSIQGPLFSTGFPDPHPLLFHHPIQIDPDIQYTASVTMEGNQLSHFGQEGMAEVMCVTNRSGRRSDREECVNFLFTPSTDSKNGTGVQGGQIPQILFYV